MQILSNKWLLVYHETTIPALEHALQTGRDPHGEIAGFTPKMGWKRVRKVRIPCDFSRIFLLRIFNISQKIANFEVESEFQLASFSSKITRHEIMVCHTLRTDHRQMGRRNYYFRSHEGCWEGQICIFWKKNGCLIWKIGAHLRWIRDEKLVIGESACCNSSVEMNIVFACLVLQQICSLTTFEWPTFPVSFTTNHPHFVKSNNHFF